MEKDSCRRAVYLFYVIIPPLFLYFLPFCYPYILLHFKMFFYYLFKIWANAILHHIGMTQNTLLPKTLEMYI